MDEPSIIIYVVDDDASIRQALKMLFLSAGMEVKTFKRAEDFLKCKLRKEKACLITDIKMKGQSGFELQRQLSENRIKIPIIFLTALDSRTSRLKAKQAGAVGYFRKPVDDQALLDVIHWALSNDPLSKS